MKPVITEQTLSSPDKLRAFLDFLEENPDGLHGVEQSAAQYVVEKLVEQGTHPYLVLRAIMYSSCSDLLFQLFYERIVGSNERRMALLDAVVRMPN